MSDNYRSEVRYLLQDRLLQERLGQHTHTFTINALNIKGCIHDLSLSGMGIEITENYGYAADKLRAEKRFFVTLEFQDFVITAEAEYVWGSVQEGVFKGGIRFLQMQQDERLKLSGIIESIRTIR